jgi:hypothetical protein
MCLAPRGTQLLRGIAYIKTRRRLAGIGFLFLRRPMKPQAAPTSLLESAYSYPSSVCIAPQGLHDLAGLFVSSQPGPAGGVLLAGSVIAPSLDDLHHSAELL